jgi:hypothetical protein
MRSEYPIRVAYKKWNLMRSDQPKRLGNKIGGIPNMLLPDEYPVVYKGERLVLLLQLMEEFRFETVVGAPSQIFEAGQGQLAEWPEASYDLLCGNRLYFFGTRIPSEESVYVLPQRAR